MCFFKYYCDIGMLLDGHGYGQSDSGQARVSVLITFPYALPLTPAESGGRFATDGANIPAGHQKYR